MSKYNDIKKYLEEHAKEPGAKDLLQKINQMSPEELDRKLNSSQGREIFKQVQQITETFSSADTKQKQELANMAQEYLKKMPQEKKEKIAEIMKVLKNK